MAEKQDDMTPEKGVLLNEQMVVQSFLISCSGGSKNIIFNFSLKKATTNAILVTESKCP